jgi:hypothetical protein
LQSLAAGDQVLATRADRLARSMFELFAIVKKIIDAGDNFSTRETTLTMVRPLRLHWAGNNHQSAPIVDLNRFTRGRQPNSRKLLNVRNYATANPPNYYPMMMYLLTARATVSQRVDVVEKLFGEPRFVPAG